MAQMQTLSIRIPDEDFQWILSLQEAGAKTASEKLRGFLGRARQQEAELASPELCSARMRELARHFVDAVATYERKHKHHSDLIGAVSEWVPQIMATLVSSRPAGEYSPEDAIEIEAVLAQQCFRLLVSLLRIAVTSVPATYDKGVLDRYLPDIVELAEIISTRKGKEPNHG